MIKYYSNLLLFLFFSASVVAQAPVINSFSPASATVGSAVTITGTNFSGIAADNIVYFGGVKASVVTTNNTSINVIVPQGSLYQPISVTVNSLTGFSRQPFITSFGIGASFQNNSFSDTLGIAPANAVCFADFDNDGIPDMVGGIANNKAAIYKNTGSLTQFSFAAGIQYAAPAFIQQIIAKDFDGDGKLDIALISTGSTAIYFLRNTTSNGTISFDATFFYLLGTDNEPFSIDATDIDGNGKTDIIVGYQSSGNAFSVVRNTSSPGSLSFAARVNFAFGVVPGGAGNVGADNTIFANDIDGDGKPDITSMSRFFPPYLIYRNTSTPGTVSFAPKVSITSNRNNTSGNGAFDMKLADIDGDGKPEIIHTFGDSSFVSLYKNASVPGNISFSSKINYPGPEGPVYITVNDMDGDTKADIVLLSYYSSCIIKNNSTPGNLSLDTPVTYYGDFAYQQVTTADLDTDGKPDIVISGSDINNNGARRALVLRNLVNGPIINSVTPITADAGSVITITGYNFLNTVLVTFGGTSAASFTVLSDTVIQAVVGNGASGDVSVATVGGIAKYPGFTFLPPIPVITSFAPTAAPVGSTVIIKGRNFSTTPADNIVYFGSGRATVSSSTDTTITVTAPTGSSYMPISVTIASRRLTAYSAIPFNTTFDSYITAFSNACFADTIGFPVSNSAQNAVTADFDNDRKPDIAAAIYQSTNRGSVLKNIGSNTTIAFTGGKDYLTSGNFTPGSNDITRVITADLNGDGKPDMPIVNSTGNYFAVFKNNSTTDSILFNSTPLYSTGFNPRYIKSADFDGDGRPDIVVSNNSANGISIFANTSSGDSISFAPKKDLASGLAPVDMAIADFDYDGKTDMAVFNFSNNNMRIFRNTSTRGTISFNDSTLVPVTRGPVNCSTADFDGDGLIDIVIANQSPTSVYISLFRNISTTGNITFDTRMDYTMPNTPKAITINDLDGDGKPDIIAGNVSNPGSMSVFKNISTPGNIILAPRVDLTKINPTGDLATADLNGDGKPEIITNNFSQRILILGNKIGDPVSVSLCPFTDTTVFNSNIPGTTFQWQEDSGNGFTDIPDNFYYTGTNTPQLTLHQVPSAWYGRKYRCVVDGTKNSDVFVLKITVRWLGTIDNAWENAGNWYCGQVPDEYTAVLIDNGTPQANSHVRIRSITVKPGAAITVGAGFEFEVLH